jgi:CheY-like chemotaxis protein
LKYDATQKAAPRRAPGSVRPVPLRGRVLVIDDEPAVGRTIQRLLEGQHDVVAMTSGEQALEILDGGAEFDVILCDLTMPQVTGPEVFARAVAAHPDLAPRFVFMTGGSFTADSRQFLDKLSNEHIDKPFDLETIRTLVRLRVAQRD